MGHQIEPYWCKVPRKQLLGDTAVFPLTPNLTLCSEWDTHWKSSSKSRNRACQKVDLDSGMLSFVDMLRLKVIDQLAVACIYLSAGWADGDIMLLIIGFAEHKHFPQ